MHVYKYWKRCTSTNIEVVDNMLPWLKSSVANQTITRDPPAHNLFTQNIKYVHSPHALHICTTFYFWVLFWCNIPIVQKYKSFDFVKFTLEWLEGALNRCFNFDQVLSLQWTHPKSRIKFEQIQNEKMKFKNVSSVPAKKRENRNIKLHPSPVLFPAPPRVLPYSNLRV